MLASAIPLVGASTPSEQHLCTINPNTVNGDMGSRNHLPSRVAEDWKGKFVDRPKWRILYKALVP